MPLGVTSGPPCHHLHQHLHPKHPQQEQVQVQQSYWKMVRWFGRESALLASQHTEQTPQKKESLQFQERGCRELACQCCR